MGEHELQAALCREADARIRGLWAEAESEVAARRQVLAAELDRQRQQADEEARQAALAVTRAAQTTSRQILRRCRLQAEAALAERLRLLAGQLLAEMADAERERLWRGCVAELPQASWQALRVAPADVERARRDFPQAEVLTDHLLLGGVVAATAAERIVVDNSLAGRLGRAWPELLPELIAMLAREANGHDPAGSPTAG